MNISGVNLFGHGSKIMSVMFGPQQVDIINGTNSFVIVRIASYNNIAEVAVNVTIIADTFASVSSPPNFWYYLVEGKVTSVTPPQGQSGTFVTISGTNLLGGGKNITSVYLDGISATVLNFTNSSVYLRMGINAQHRTGFVPGEVYLVTDTGAIVTADSGVTFFFHELGIITGFSPLVGREGTFITITGINLTAYGNKIIHVTIGGIDVLQNSIDFNSSDPTKLFVRAGPSNTTTNGRILLFVDTGTIVNSNTTYNFTYSAPGIITMVTPSSGVEGTGVLITGSDLYIANTSLVNIFLAGVCVTKVVVATRTSIAVIAGSPEAPNNISTEVLITASDGSVARGTAFKYNTPHQLKIVGPMLGQFGTRVSLNVTENFIISGKFSVLVDGIPATVLSKVGTTVNITVPRPKKIGTYPVNIVMQNTKGELARLVDGFTYIQEGEIIKVTPRNGQQGTSVTIIGYGLLGGGSFIQSATLANLPATIIVNSSDTLVILEVMRNSDNNINDNTVGDIVLIANTGAVTRQLRGWTATIPAVISNVHPVEGQLGTYVTITGSNLLQGDLNISSVQLAGVNAYSIVSFSSTVIVVRAPNASFNVGGSVKIILGTGAYTESSVLWTYTARTVISSVFPVIGAVGSTVMIRLARYSSESDSIKIVLLDNANCSILAVGTDFVNVTIPVGNYSTYPVGIVILTTSGVIISKNAAFTVEELGNIYRITPRIIQQGIIVNISGHNFLGHSNATYITAVWLAGVQAKQIISQSNYSVIVEAGYSANTISGNVELLLNTAVNIVSNITVSYYRSQILSVIPNDGYNATQLNITGINLIQPNSTLASVMIGNVVAAVEENSRDYIIARAGEPSISDINVNMTVKVTSQSGAYIELHNGWRYNAIPTITRVHPNTIVGGEIITIYGRNLPADNASTILIGGISVQQLLYANSTVIQARAPYGINRSELQQIQIFAADRSVVTSIPLVRYNTINYTILSISPYAGQNGTKVNITFNFVPPNITAVYLAAVKVTTITRISNSSITVIAGYGTNATGDVIIETATGLLLGIQNGWSYLPELNSSQVIPQQGQSGTLITIRIEASVLVKYILSAVSLAGVPANIIGITIDTILVKAGSSSFTGMSDVVLSFQGGIVLLIPQSWTYLPDISITSVSNNATGYFGTAVVIYGTNFLNGRSSQVRLNVTLASSISTNIISFNDTTIICNISQFVESIYLPIVGPITVQNSFGFNANTSGKLNFTYLDVDIMSVFPNQGQNGTIVTIQGTELLAGATNVTGVLLNDVPVNKVIISTNNMIVVQAAHYYRSTSLGNITYFTNTEAKITIPKVWRYVSPAVVSTVTPINGTEGTIVTIRGTELLAGSNIGPSSVNSVYLNGAVTSKVLIAFDTIIQVVIIFSSSNDSIPGAVSILLSSGAWIFTTKTFNYFQPGVVTSINPLEGQNGTIVNITGISLYPIGDCLMSVTLAEVNAHIVSATTNLIQVVAARPSILESFGGAVIIQALSGAVLTYKISNFTYLQEGLIYSVSPSRGQNQTTVEIKGYNLFGGGSGIRGVWLAGIAAYINPDSTDDCVVVTVGENIASYNESITGDVLLVSTSGAHIRRVDGWLYEQKGVILNITPSSGQYGTEIVITGVRLLSGATAVSSVTIGGVPIDVTMSSDNVIRGKIGNPMSGNAFNGTVIITSSHGGILVSNYTWSYNKRGIINSFVPTTGGNNAKIKITGTDLLGSGRQIVLVAVAGIHGANIVSQNNTIVVIQLGTSTVALNVTGPITLVANTGAIIQSTDMFTLFVPCDLNQFTVNNSDSVNCVNCSSVCASCSGPTDSDCTECTAASFILQTYSNGTKQCTKQCRKFASSDRECLDSCEIDQYQNHIDAENTTFCYECSDLCAPNSNCTGPAPTQCRECMFFRYRMECVSECPQHTFVDQSNICIQCHSLCNQSAGCTGPSTADCHSCAHFTIRDNTTDTCVNKCPSNYYINGTTCLPCDPLCVGRCKGDGPRQCEECRFAGMRLFDGFVECVSSCNQPSVNIYYLDNSTGICERCSDFCSLVDGCNGPSPSNCHRCRGLNSINTSTPATFKFDTACILDCSSISNDTAQYYNDLVTLSCQLCDFSCNKGCTGPGSSNCITATAPVEKTETFEAGTGTIIVFSALCAVLVILIIICSTAFLIQKKWRHSKYNSQLSHSGRQNTETGRNYVTVRSSEETEFNRSATIKGTSEELAATTTYTDISNNDNTMDVKPDIPKINPELELYVDVPNAPQQSEKLSNLPVTNPIACGGEYEFPVPSTAISNDGGYEDNDVYDDASIEPTKTPYHEIIKSDCPALPPDREKRSSMPIPSNPLEISMSKIISQQQGQQDAIYDVAQVEDSIYDDIGVAKGFQSHTTSKPS